jgi:diaminopimelate decarboxylase
MKPANLTGTDLSMALKRALQQRLFRPEDSALIFYDLNHLDQRLKYLHRCFPPNTLHGMAIKANPLRRVLEGVRERFPWAGIEAASMGEVHQGLTAGFPPAQIVYDSPVKTIPELDMALTLGIHINADNFAELERIDALLSARRPKKYPLISAGLRINPQVGLGSILESSVAGTYSKFGVPLDSGRKRILEVFQQYPWLNGLHLHVGSQGCKPEMLAEGVGRLYHLMQEINALRDAGNLKRIDVFDIGGGLPVSYNAAQSPPSMEEYVDLLRKSAPGLFPDENPGGQGTALRIITEFGRWVFTNSGFTISRVEYVKEDPGVKTAMIHVGADLLVRECLNPSDWQHEFSVFDPQGNLKSGMDRLPWNLAGPLCFSGDIIAKNVTLPEIEPGDFLAIHDTGSYTFSMWSRYNSRQTPRILGFRESNFTILKEREALSELVKFWE